MNRCTQEQILKDIEMRTQARDECEAFLAQWTVKYNTPPEVYRGLNYLMNSYVQAFVTMRREGTEEENNFYG